MKYIIANWKANKILKESLEWLIKFSKIVTQQKTLRDVEVVICPNFVVLAEIKKKLVELNLSSSVKLGSQTVSPYEDGPYTGQVTASMLSGLVDYCLIGHSETRKEMGMTDAKISAALRNLQKQKIKPVLLASKFAQVEVVKSSFKKMDRQDYAITFEPVEAISKGGTYKSYSPVALQKIVADWKNKLSSNCRVFYGGSVNPENISTLIEESAIDGVVVGKASLNPSEFARIVEYASQIKT